VAEVVDPLVHHDHDHIHVHGLNLFLKNFMIFGCRDSEIRDKHCRLLRKTAQQRYEILNPNYVKQRLT
jgi:hypothetical protein